MDAIIENLPTFLGGFWNTLQLLFYSGIGALVLGTIIAAMRISPVAALRGFATVYTEILRNIPLTLVLFFCAFLLPYLGVRLEYFTFAVIGLTAYTSPFIAEAIRSGINGVALGQAEAARAIEHISLVEIANAMAIAAEESAGLSPDELRRETLAIFGGKRVTAAIGARLDEALEFGLASGRLARSGETIVAQTV